MRPSGPVCTLPLPLQCTPMYNNPPSAGYTLGARKEPENKPNHLNHLKGGGVHGVGGWGVSDPSPPQEMLSCEAKLCPGVPQPQAPATETPTKTAAIHNTLNHWGCDASRHSAFPIEEVKPRIARNPMA